jgi:hypothetical protein
VISHFLKKKLDDSDKRNEFHKEIQVEIGKQMALFTLEVSPKVKKCRFFHKHLDVVP